MIDEELLLREQEMTDKLERIPEKFLDLDNLESTEFESTIKPLIN